MSTSTTCCKLAGVGVGLGVGVGVGVFTPDNCEPTSNPRKQTVACKLAGVVGKGWGWGWLWTVVVVCTYLLLWFSTGLNGAVAKSSDRLVHTSVLAPKQSSILVAVERCKITTPSSLSLTSNWVTTN